MRWGEIQMDIQDEQRRKLLASTRRQHDGLASVPKRTHIGRRATSNDSWSSGSEAEEKEIRTSTHSKRQMSDDGCWHMKGARGKMKRAANADPDVDDGKKKNLWSSLMYDEEDDDVDEWEDEEDGASSQ